MSATPSLWVCTWLTAAPDTSARSWKQKAAGSVPAGGVTGSCGAQGREPQLLCTFLAGQMHLQWRSLLGHADGVGILTTISTTTAWPLLESRYTCSRERPCEPLDRPVCVSHRLVFCPVQLMASRLAVMRISVLRGLAARLRMFSRVSNLPGKTCAIIGKVGTS